LGVRVGVGVSVGVGGGVGVGVRVRVRVRAAATGSAAQKEGSVRPSKKSGGAPTSWAICRSKLRAQASTQRMYSDSLADSSGRPVLTPPAAAAGPRSTCG